MLRSALSATFSLFAHGLYTNLDPNLATSVLTTVTTFACLGPVILIQYGKRIQEASRFAQYSLTVDNGVGVGLPDITDPIVVTATHHEG